MRTCVCAHAYVRVHVCTCVCVRACVREGEREKGEQMHVLLTFCLLFSGYRP